MLFKDDPHALLYVKTTLHDVIASCRDLDFKNDSWRCKYCGNSLTKGHDNECPVVLLEAAAALFKEEYVQG